MWMSLIFTEIKLVVLFREQVEIARLRDRLQISVLNVKRIWGN